MERQVRTLTRLVDDLLDVSRITRGKIELQKESIDLATVIARAIETTGPLFEPKHIPVEVDVSRGIRFEGDPLRLEQVLGNLLHNAAKFTPEGGRVEVHTLCLLGLEITGRMVRETSEMDHPVRPLQKPVVLGEPRDVVEQL